MKKFTKAIAAAAVAVIVGAGSAFAAEAPNCGTVGLGYQGIFGGDVLQGVSVRGWLAQEFAVEGNFYYGSVDVDVNGVDIADPDLILGTLKAMYAPVVNSNSRFYVGIEGGLGSVDLGFAGAPDVDLYVINPLIGAEHYFSEFPELGFNWEVGYKIHGIDVDAPGLDVDVSIDGVFVALGAHYYL